MKKKNNTGFTLAEMLIVVAIIGVLIAIAFGSIRNSLERAREATDLANIKSAYSEMMNMIMYDEPSSDRIAKTSTGYKTFIRCKSTISGWQTTGIEKNGSGNVLIGNAYCTSPHSTKPYICLTYTASTNTFTFARYSTPNVSSPTYYN